MEDDLRGRVRDERERRGWSFNTAGRIGGVAGETWRLYEHGGNLSRKVQRAIAAAFAWPLEWPEGVDLPQPHPSSAEERDDAILVELHASRLMRERLIDEVRRLNVEADVRARSLGARMTSYEAAIDHLRRAVEGLADRFDRLDVSSRKPATRPVPERSDIPAPRSRRNDPAR